MAMTDAELLEQAGHIFAELGGVGTSRGRVIQAVMLRYQLKTKELEDVKKELAPLRTRLDEIKELADYDPD